MAEQDLDRNEQATPYKLAEARKRGQVARSPDVTTAVVMAAALGCLYATGWDGLRSLFRLDGRLLAQATTASPTHLLAEVTAAGMQLMVPVLVVVMIAGILGNLVQTGPVLSFFPVKPDLSRVSPVAGLQRLFSMRTLFDLLRGTAKLALLGGVAWLALKSLLPQFQQLRGASALGLAHLIVEDVASIGTKLVLALAVIAAIDFLYTRRQFSQKLRMSKREIKEEHRHREGDPRIRARLRELRRSMLKRTAALRRTKDADVLITNPTHVAIALQYRHGEMAAPRLLCKGAGVTAAAMRRMASRHHVPIVQNRVLARALYAEVEINQPVPPSHFAAVAKIMVWVMARKGVRPNAAAPRMNTGAAR